MNGRALPVRESGGHRFAIALGSNQGNRLKHLRLALQGLEATGIRPFFRVSTVFKTPPLGYESQPDFLNLVLLSDTDLPPGSVLSIFKALEEEAGRKPEFRNAPQAHRSGPDRFRDPETGWEVLEVGRLWPMEPRDIRVVRTAEGFQEVSKEWKE